MKNNLTKHTSHLSANTNITMNSNNFCPTSTSDFNFQALTNAAYVLNESDSDSGTEGNGNGNRVSGDAADALIAKPSTQMPRNANMIFKRSVTMLTKKLVRELSESYRRCFPRLETMDEDAYEARLEATLLKKIIPSKLNELNKIKDDPQIIGGLKRAENAQRQRAFRERRRGLKEKEKILQHKDKVDQLQSVVDRHQFEIEKGKSICEQLVFRKRKLAHDEEDYYESIIQPPLMSNATSAPMPPAVATFTSSSGRINSVHALSGVACGDSTENDDVFSISTIGESVSPCSQRRVLSTPCLKVTKFNPLACAEKYLQVKYPGDDTGIVLVRQSKYDFFKTAINGIYAGAGRIIIHRKELKEKLFLIDNHSNEGLPGHPNSDEAGYLKTLKDRYWLLKRVRQDLDELIEILQLSCTDSIEPTQQI